MKKLFLIMYFLVLTLGCAALPPIKIPQITEANLPPQCHIEGIKIIKQDYKGCVPACLEMVFNFNGKQLTKESIANWIQRAYGTGSRDLEDFVRWQGFNYHTFYDWNPQKKKIKYFLAQGYPVLVGGQVRHESERHMIVLVGYNDLKEVSSSLGWYGLPGEKTIGVFIALDPGFGGVIEIPYKRFKEFHSPKIEPSYYGLVIYPKR